MREPSRARAKNLAHESVTGRGSSVREQESLFVHVRVFVHTVSIDGLVRDATVEYGNQEAILYSQGKRPVSIRGAKATGGGGNICKQSSVV